MKPSFTRPLRSGPVRGWSRRAMQLSAQDDTGPGESERAPAPRVLRLDADGSLTRGGRTDRLRRAGRP